MNIKHDLQQIINSLCNITDLIKNHPIDAAFTAGAICNQIEHILQEMEKWDNQNHGC